MSMSMSMKSIESQHDEGLARLAGTKTRNAR